MKIVRPAQFELLSALVHTPKDQLARRHYFRVVASNGRILCHSETYNTRRACMNAIRAVQDAATKVIER